MLRDCGLGFVGNFAGAFLVAVMMAVIFPFAFSQAPDAVGQKLGTIGAERTVGYAEEGAAGMLPLSGPAQDRRPRSASRPDSRERVRGEVIAERVN